MSVGFPKLELPCRRCGSLVCDANFLCHQCSAEMLIDWPKAKVIFEGGRTSADFGRDQVLDAVVLSLVLLIASEKEKGEVVGVYTGQNGYCYITVDGTPVAFVLSSLHRVVYMVATFPGISGQDETVSINVEEAESGERSYLLRRHGRGGATIGSQVLLGEDALLMQNSFFYAAVQCMFS